MKNSNTSGYSYTYILFNDFVNKYSSSLNLDQYSNDDLLNMASAIIVDFLNKIHEADLNLTHQSLDNIKFLTAKLYLETIYKRYNKNAYNCPWDLWYKYGILELIQDYDFIYDGSNPKPFIHFKFAVTIADNDSIKNIILPFINNSKIRYMKRYEFGLVSHASGNSFKEDLYKYYDFYRECGDIAEPYKLEIKHELTKDVEPLIAEMNNYKEKIISLTMEAQDKTFAIASLKRKPKNGFFRQKEIEKDLEQIQLLREQRTAIQSERTSLINKAYSELRFVQNDIPDFPSKERFSQIVGSIIGKFHDVYEMLRQTNPDTEKIKLKYKDIDELLSTCGFAPEFYIERYFSPINSSSSRYYQLKAELIPYDGKELLPNKSVSFFSYSVASFIKPIYIFKYFESIPMLTVYENYIYEGHTPTGNLLYKIDGDKIYKGNEDNIVLYTVRDDKIYLGTNTFTSPLYEIKENKICKCEYGSLIPVFTIKKENEILDNTSK